MLKLVPVKLGNGSILIKAVFTPPMEGIEQTFATVELSEREAEDLVVSLIDCLPDEKETTCESF